MPVAWPEKNAKKKQLMNKNFLSGTGSFINKDERLYDVNNKNNNLLGDF